MKEKKIYSKVYDYRGHQVSYPEILKYIKDNFIEGPIMGSLLNSKQNYTSLEKDVLIKVNANMNETIENNNYKAIIIIEKAGPNAKKTSKIETLLLKEGFKKELKKDN